MDGVIDDATQVTAEAVNPEVIEVVETPVLAVPPVEVAPLVEVPVVQPEPVVISPISESVVADPDTGSALSLDPVQSEPETMATEPSQTEPNASVQPEVEAIQPQPQEPINPPEAPVQPVEGNTSPEPIKDFPDTPSPVPDQTDQGLAQSITSEPATKNPSDPPQEVVSSEIPASSLPEVIVLNPELSVNQSGIQSTDQIKEPKIAILEAETTPVTNTEDTEAEDSKEDLLEDSDQPPLADRMVQSEYSDAVLALSDDELKKAMKLYLQRHQIERARHGVAKRQAKMQKNLDEVVAYITTHGSAQIPRMARELNLSPALVSSYVQKLVKQGRIRAEGWQKGRRYMPVEPDIG